MSINSTDTLALPSNHIIFPAQNKVKESVQVSAQKNAQKNAQKTAKDFEVAFIAQMLQYSGLADALTSSGGEDMQSFSQFYLEALAKNISDNGGFGIAEKIYTHIKNKEDKHDELGRL